MSINRKKTENSDIANRRKLFFAAVLLTFFASTVTAEKGPALWRFGDDDTTVYLFGTIHLMRQDVNWFTDTVKNAFNKADILVLEVDQSQVNRQQQQRALRNSAFFHQDTKLSDVIPRRYMKQLLSLLEPMQIPKKVIERWRPWYAALTVTNITAEKAGFSGEHGVENVLFQKAYASNINITGLETLEEQLQLFSGLDKEQSVYFLTDALDERDNMEEMFHNLKDSWMHQDFVTIKKIMQESKKEAPQFYDKVYIKRNFRWVSKITGFLDTEGTFFVAVGAGHLIGENGVVDMLKDRGIPVVKE